jgi:nitroreductase
MFADAMREAFYTIIKSRRSIREFLEDDIPDEVLDRILETGRRSASAANRQPWEFVVARRREDDPLYALVAGRSFEQAPVLVMGLADRRQGWLRRQDRVNYAPMDVAIALTEMILAATAEGLGTCWVAAFDPAAARAILALPETVDPVGMMALGRPVEPLRVEEEKPRKSLNEIVRRGSGLR